MIALILFAAMQQSDSARLERSLEREVTSLQQAEMLVANALSKKQTLTANASASLQRREVVLRRTTALLDTVVLHTSWGGNKLASLRRRFPASQLLLEFDARLAMQQNRLADALRTREQILRIAPADTSAQRAYAVLLDQMGRNPEARLAFTRLIEAVPEDEAAFRALVRLSDTPAALDELLARIKRLQIRLPDSRKLKEREVELLYKLNRPAQADSLIKALKGRTS